MLERLERVETGDFPERGHGLVLEILWVDHGFMMGNRIYSQLCDILIMGI
jgi:hypothetical protein